jgi:predicted MFS family arabinose efflux permease
MPERNRLVVAATRIFARLREIATSPFTRLVLAATSAWFVAYLSYYAQAQMMGKLMEKFAQGEAAVGMLSSFENGAFFITMMLAAGPVARISRAKTAIFGGLVLVAANVASAYATDWQLVFALRVIAGAGAGLVSACGTAALASAINPDRAFAIVTVTSGLLYTAEPRIIPYATVPYGVQGGYLLLAAISLVFVPFFIGLLPASRVESEEEEAPLIALLLEAPNRTLAIIAMVALFSFEIGQAAVYQFIAVLGELAGLGEMAVGRVLGDTALLGLAGGVFAAVLGTRFGRKWPIIIGLLLNSAAAAGLALQSDPTSYWMLNLLWGLAYNFSVPYLMGALSALDDRGRWVVAADGAWNGGTAVGPGLAGVTVQAAGYPPLAVLAMTAGLVCMFLMTIVVTRLGSQQTELDGPAAAVPPVTNA